MRFWKRFTAILFILPAPAFSTSPDSWAEFAQLIETECRALVSEGERKLEHVNAKVEQYNGIVLLIGVNRAGEEALTVCVYDKKERNAWLGDEWTPSLLRPQY